MHLSLFDRKKERNATPGCSVERRGATLRVIENPSWEPRVIPGGEGRTTEPVRIGVADAIDGSVEVRAEIRAKRFIGDRVADDRYAATVRAAAATPHALITALTQACAEIEGFHTSHGPDERVILQISLIR